MSKNSPSTNVLPSTSRPSATKKAVTTSRSATVRPTWSKRRTCDIGPSSRRCIDRASATVGVLSTSRCGTSANAPQHSHSGRRGRLSRSAASEPEASQAAPGSVVKVAIAERGSMRYTFHGGGPCDGALNGAVMPSPLSSGSAGQPWSAHAFATRASAPGSVTRAASPSTTTSASRTDTAIEHRGSRSTLRPFRVLAAVWNQNMPGQPQGTDRRHMRATVLVDGGQPGRARV